MPVIRTERLVLTVVGPWASSAMVRYLKDNAEHFAPWFSALPPEGLTEEYWRGRHREQREAYREGRSLPLTLFRKESPRGAVVGVCNFTQIYRAAFQACYLGYSIDHRCEGTGMMREALEAALRYVFEEMGLHRVMANYQPTNERSGALLRRLGFTVEGCARDYLYINGAWRDHVLTSLTAPGAIRNRYKDANDPDGLDVC